jgi:serine/threonine-protein kinase haspin
MISLPTPVDTSREKLKSKLRASTSLLSLTRLDRSINNTVMAVPVEQYNLSQMEKLLNFCEIPTVLDFQAYLDRVAAEEDEVVFTKISVTSSSEVFAQGSKVYKIIPFGNEESDQSAIQDILQEIEISRTLQVLDGFVDVLEIVVVKGRYPQQLLPREYGTHIQPYAEDQKYCILVLNNAGKDLRRFRVESWADAESIFWQTAVALAQAEERFQFEHRDLHWGNIVVDDRPDERVAPPQEGDGTVTYSLADECGKQLLARSTLRITLIDYTLSRINAETSGRTATIHTRLDQPEFFRGKGDYQLDVYRFMRNNILSNGPSPDDGSAPNTPTSLRSNTYGTGVDWSVYVPKTNVYWLHYVAERLINHKGLRSANPAGTLRRNGASSSSSSSATATTPTSLHTPGTTKALESDLQAEEIQSCRTLEAVYRALDPRKHRNNSNETATTTSVINDLGSARDVLRWGIKTKTFPGHCRA